MKKSFIILPLGLALGLFSTVRADDVTPRDYGNVGGPPVPASAPGATDAAGTGTDSALGVTHAASSGAARNGASVSDNSRSQPENYGNSSGPAATRATPGATDETGTGPDAATGITHSQSGGGTMPAPPPPVFRSGYR